VEDVAHIITVVASVSLQAFAIAVITIIAIIFIE
jgi:hypothetical protein